MLRSRLLPLALILPLALAVAGFDWFAYQGSFQRTLTVSGPVEMSVATGSGSIEVSRGGGGTVSIQARIRGRDQARVQAIERNPPVHQEGNIIEIGRLSGDLGRGIAISYTIVTPSNTSLRVSSGSGSDTVSGLAGPVRAETGSGSVALRQIGNDATASTGSGDATVVDAGGMVHVATGSGSIDVERAGGAVRASAGSGGIGISGAGGGVRASTGSGSIRIAAARGDVSAETGSGQIVIAGGLPAGSRWEARSGSGGIALHVPAGAAAEVDLYSGSGGIDSSLPLTVEGTINRHEIHGYLHESAGGNGGMIVARTSSGTIRID